MSISNKISKYIERGRTLSIWVYGPSPPGGARTVKLFQKYGHCWVINSGGVQGKILS